MSRVILVLLLCLAACNGTEAHDERLHGVFGEYYEALLEENPEVATSLGRNDHDDRWRDWSRPAREIWVSRLEGFHADLEAFDPAALDEQDRLSLALLRRQIRTELAGLDYESYMVRLNQLFGLHTIVFLTLREMPASTEEDYGNILARLEALPAYIDENIATLREALDEGIAQPRLVVDHIIRQLEVQASVEPEDSPLLAAFRDIPASVPPAARDELAGRAVRAYAEAFQPSWRKLRSFLAEEYAPRARATLAVSGLSGGDAIYRFFIEYHTTLPLDAAQIHETGLREVERIETEMAAIAREAGFDSADSFERHITTDRKYLFTSREQMLSYHRDIAMRIAPGLSRLFHRLPRHRVGIRAIPKDREAVSASNYNAPAVNGSRPGWFNLKAYRAETQSRYDKPALVIHETNPGHHFQIATQLEQEGLPEFRKIYQSTAYVEGWALYAESLGGQLGVYDDPASRFGALASERFRARRLVVDTGLHAMDWERQRAVDYLGDPSEVDRYIAWPGQALAYKTGQLKIQALKEAACAAYGASFDVRDFHDAVLRSGPLPLEMLEEQVRAYIALAEPGDPGPCPDPTAASVQ